ncbi:Efflux pump afoB [Madurella fahalii]|uniref:Efflux pump afoB n=1 Tax=Madurella fahalii TaxID=1157608 RepID=A0ABQ0GEE6_9PEZI
MNVTPQRSKRSVDEKPDSSSTEVAKDAAMGPVDDAQYVTGMKLAILAASVTVVVFLMMTDASIISTAIPRITDEFRSLPDVGWYTSIYQLGNAVLQPLMGKIYSKFSAKATFLAFFGIFEIGSLICGATTSSTMLIVGRAIAGAGSAGLMNGALIISASAVPLDKLPSLTGVIMGLSQLGIVFGPLVGGAFTSYTTWRWAFYINLPIGAVVALAILLLKIPDRCEKPSPLIVLKRLHLELDLIGFALIAPAAVQLLLALHWGGSQYAWDSPTIVGLLCGTGGTTLVWLLWNWCGGKEALIPFSMIKQRTVWSAALTQCFLLTTVYCASFFLPIYFQAVHGASPMMSGVYMLASILSQLLMAIVAGVLVERTGYAIPYGMAAGVIGAITNGLYSTLSPTTPTALWVVYQVVNGIGRGLGMQMPVLAVQAVLAPADLAVGVSIVVFAQSLGNAIALAVSDAIFEGSLEAELRNRVPQADSAAIITAGATHFRSVVNEWDLPGVLMAYSIAIGRIFYLGAGVTGLAVFTSLFLGWVDIRKKKKADRDPEQPETGSG